MAVLCDRMLFTIYFNIILTVSFIRVVMSSLNTIRTAEVHDGLFPAIKSISRRSNFTGRHGTKLLVSQRIQISPE